jgi:hypothetical protein
MSSLKGLVFLASIVGAAALGVVACSDDENLTGGSNSSSGNPGGNKDAGGNSDGGDGTHIDPTKPVVDVTGDITASRTLTADTTWRLKNLVSVKAGATLTIEKGTTIVGASNTQAILLVETGAKIMAEGTANEPIIFTSEEQPGRRVAGDWGGVILLGKAPINVPGGTATVEGILKNGSTTSYGGTDPEDNSGVLRYVRIEYAGVVLSTDNEVNGLTFAGVGRGTKVDHIQVRHALDDCFEFFGGTVDAHHLICQYNQDDGFDTDNGYSGRLQFLVLQQDPNHPGEDNGFESDNDATGTANTPLTGPTVFNATMCGKNTDPESAQYGALIRRNSGGSYNNIIWNGFEAGLDVRDKSTADRATAGTFSIKGSLFWNSKGAGVLENVAYPENGAAAPNKDNDGAFDELAWIKTAAFGNKTTVDPKIADCFSPTAPKFGPATSLTDGAVTPPNDGFFDATATYMGAFKDANDNWATEGKWAIWTDK